jgi:hypothetical protein
MSDSQVIQGQTIALISTFLDAPGGDPVDPTSVSLTILRAGNPVAGPFTYAGSEILRDAVGLYRYEYTSAQQLSWTPTPPSGPQ